VSHAGLQWGLLLELRALDGRRPRMPFVLLKAWASSQSKNAVVQATRVYQT
jgi:hypothetical protein